MGIATTRNEKAVERGAESVERRAKSGERRAKSNERRAWSGERRAKKEKGGKRMFRFENLEIWKRSIELTDQLFDIADNLERQKLYRFAEQLRGAALSISNNIAEGSGSNHKKEFIQFLNIAKRSCFENANMVILFQRRGHISTELKQSLFAELDEICRMISGFITSLRS